MNHYVLVLFCLFTLSGVESVFADSAAFAESCLRSVKVILKDMMISYNCCPKQIIII